MVKKYNTEYRFIIFITFATFFSMGITENSRGPVYPDILQSFDIDTIRGSLIFTLASFSGLITNLFSKVWLFRFGVFKSSRFFLFMQFFGTAGIALSSMTGSYIYLLCSSILIGIGISGIGITGNVIIGNVANNNNGRRYFSFLHSMYGAASFLAPIIISFIRNKGVSWEKALLVISTVPLIFGLLSFKEKGKVLKKKNRVTYNIPFKDGLIWGLIVSLYIAAEILISSRSVYIAQEVFHKTNQEASFYLSLFFILLLSGRIVFSVIKFPGSNKFWILSSIILSLILNLLGIFYNPIFLSLTGLSMSIIFPCVLDYLNLLFKEKSERIVSIILTYVAGMLVLMHLLFGWLANMVGLMNAALIGPVFLFIVIILLLLSFLLYKNVEQ